MLIINIKINCVTDDENVVLPKYESVCASGMDLRAWKFSYIENLKQTFDIPEEGVWLRPSQRMLIKTGLHIELPENIEAQIRPRSGLALKNGVTVLNTPGTIDEDYRGDIGVILMNFGDKPIVIKKNDRIAQIVFQKVEKFDLNVVDKLSETIRGDGGFSSTGSN